ncbi:serine-rich adhesin for platelets-like [Ylistrum balloti]|uniref:serine-rich adhesin for platelets-like n=1 Tax=Ylistrum balloti TaxID=509963 RepID=UPI002905874C|nr:serine-rich adhesin for platelets-like [Ylistrum balloti]
MRSKVTSTFLVLLLISLLQGVPDHAGTEFIVGFMSIVGSDQGASLIISTSIPTEVKVLLSTADGSYRVNLNVSCNRGQKVYLPASIRLQDGIPKDSKGIIIESSGDIVVTGSNAASSSYDSFMALPTNVIGSDYFAVTYSQNGQVCQVLVVGVNDSTTVKITLNPSLKDHFVLFENRQYLAGQTFTVELNRYETFEFESIGDLSGTRIRSNNIIAVFSGNKDTYIGSRTYLTTNLVEQLTPVDTWGNVFILVPVPYAYASVLFWLLASENSTTINLSGDFTPTTYTIHEGETIQIECPHRNLGYLVSNKPILVIEFSQGYSSLLSSNNPTMILIPPVEQFHTTYTFRTVGFVNYFVFVVQKDHFEGLLYDGKVFPSSSLLLTSVTGTNFATSFISVSDGSHTVRHSLPHVTFGGFLYGYVSSVSTFGIPLGMRMVAINFPCRKSQSEVGDGKDNDCDGRIDEEPCIGNGDKDEDGDGLFNEDCVAIPEVDGGWSTWAVSKCSLTCSDGTNTGIQSKQRSCTNPIPRCDGERCEGNSFETSECLSEIPCPINGDWTEWSSWTSCSVTCSWTQLLVTGKKQRTRECTNPVPQFDGSPCVGSGISVSVCSSTQKCPVPDDEVTNAAMHTADVFTNTAHTDDVSSSTMLTDDVSSLTVVTSALSTTTTLMADKSTTLTSALSTTTALMADTSTTTSLTRDISTTTTLKADKSTTTTLTSALSTTTSLMADKSTTSTLTRDISTTTTLKADKSTTTTLISALSTTTTLMADTSTTTTLTSALSTTTTPMADTSTTTVLNGGISPTTILMADKSTTTALIGDISTTTTLTADKSTTTTPTGDISTTTTLMADKSTTTALIGDISTTTAVIDDVTTTTTEFFDDTSTAGVLDVSITHGDLSTSSIIPLTTSYPVPYTMTTTINPIESGSLSTTTDSETTHWSTVDIQTTIPVDAYSITESIAQVSDNPVSTPATSLICNCNTYTCFNPDVDELYQIIKQLKAELRIFRNQTSRYKRSLVSADDKRPSAQAAGYIGTLILAGLGVFLIAMDKGNLLNMFTIMKTNLRSR